MSMIIENAFAKNAQVRRFAQGENARNSGQAGGQRTFSVIRLKRNPERSAERRTLHSFVRN